MSKLIFLLTIFFILNSFADENKLINFDYSKAIKIGNGSKIIIEFADPECVGCRKSENYLEEFDITRYIILSPLDFHPNSKALSIHILCSDNPAEEFKKSLKGILDQKELLVCQEGLKKLDEMQQIRKMFKATEETPIFLTQKDRMEGFNKKKMNEILEKIKN